MHEDHPQNFAYIRTYGDEKLLVISNFSKESVLFELDAGIEVREFKLILSNYDKDYTEIKAMSLEPYESLILSIK